VRLPGRPFTSVVLAGAMLALASIVAWAFLAHEKPHPDRLAAAKVQAEADYRQAVRFAEHERQRCGRAPEAGGCDRIPSPRRSDYHWFVPGSFNMHYEFPYMIMFFAMILATAAYPIGAAAAGRRTAWMADAVDMIDPESCDFERVPDCVHDTLILTRPVAGSVMAALTLAVVGAAVWSAHRRDIG
jgi:TRAP-type C4-dicarboxylate transport system permease large subunit